MPLAQLITADQLAARLQDPSLRILDCRYALDDREYGQHSHANGHIPGASHVDLERDLSGKIIAGETGRHPLPRPADMIARLEEVGVSNDSEIVLYDDAPGAFAARAWWLLAWLGKRDGVYLLDGGFQAWQEAGLPIEQHTSAVPPGRFVGQPDDSLVMDAAALSRELESPRLMLIDARALPRFLGEVEPIDPVAGHIPGAVCVPFTDNLDLSGRFLPPDLLRTRFDQQLAGRSAQDLIAYCGSGVTACHNLFALCLAGYPLGKLYPGSWSEWIIDPGHPVA